MDGQPIFNTSEDCNLWKSLCKGVPSNKFNQILEKVLASNRTIHSVLLSRVMEEAVKNDPNVSDETIRKIAAKSRQQDCMAAVTAANIFIERKEPQAAVSLIGCSRSKDLLSKSVAKADAYLAEGDMKNAKANAKVALGIDPSCDRAYEILTTIDEDGNWDDVRKVQSIAGKKDIGAPEDPRLKELYLIYRDWYGGNKDAASDRLINSQYYMDKDWEFLLASARTSVDEKDWRSAKMMYFKIIEDAPDYVICEAAEAYVLGHDPEYALQLYKKLSSPSRRSMKGEIAAYSQMRLEDAMSKAIERYLDDERTDVDDYSECITLLINSGKSSEAKKLLDEMKASDRNNPVYLVSYSSYLLEVGDIQGAKRVSREAVKVGRGDIGVRIQDARMKFISGDCRSAEKECDKVLATDPYNRDALVLKKDILVKLNDVEHALEVCNRILEVDPTDVYTMMTLSGAMSCKGDTNGSMNMLKNVLKVDPSRENVLNVVGSMIEAGMYREAMFLCYDLEKECPPDPLFRRLRGNAEYLLKDYIKASASYAAAAELAPNDPMIWHSKGMADEARGDFQSAEASYDRAILLDLNRSEFWISKAAMQERSEDIRGAVESLNRAIELDPDSIYPMVRKAAIMESEGRYPEALYLLNVCSMIAGCDRDVALMRVRVLRESGQKEQAYEAAKDLYDELKADDALAELALCLASTGRSDEAANMLKNAINSGNESLLLRRTLDTIEDREYTFVIHDESVDDTIESTSDVNALVSMAESLMVLGDVKGAMRSIDRAVSISDEDPMVICAKCGLMLKTDDIQGAFDLVTEAIKDKPRNAELHVAMGDVKLARSEYRGAIQEYDKAMDLGLSSPDILAKRGDAQQGLGYFDKSIESYVNAVKMNPARVDLEYILAEKLYERGNPILCINHLKAVLNKEQGNVKAIILYAKVQKDMRHDDEITGAYRLFSRCSDPDKDDIAEMIGILEEAGHESEVNALRGCEHAAESDKRVMRSVEKVLRRAYTSRTRPDDIDFIESLGFDGEYAEDIRNYITAPVYYGDITPGTMDFQKMERLSNSIIMKMGLKDLESDTHLRLEEVYIQGSFKEVDDAKRFIAYVEKALSADVVEDPALGMVLEKVQGNSLYDIMKSCKVGIYQARQIRLLM